MTLEVFTFAELDKRIEKIPDTPGETQLFPKELMVWEAIGIGGTVMGLLPSVFVLFIEPANWMVVFAQIGLLIMAIGFLPGFLHTCWYLVKDIWHWRKRFNRNADFALGHYRDLIQWLMQFPKEDLQEYAQFIRDTQTRMGDKLGLMVGGMQQLGFVPALVAVVTQVQEFQALGSLPPWRIILAFFLILMYAVTISVSLMRLRARLYEMLLTQAINKTR
jgi:ABC-type long-subunit fatty acid transport system fused permease/ATPase subunit